MRSLRTGPMNPEQAHMQAVKNIAELVARRSQVRCLRKIAKALYLAGRAIPPYWRSQEMVNAIALYIKEML